MRNAIGLCQAGIASSEKDEEWEMNSGATSALVVTHSHLQFEDQPKPMAATVCRNKQLITIFSTI